MFDLYQKFWKGFKPFKKVRELSCNHRIFRNIIRFLQFIFHIFARIGNISKLCSYTSPKSNPRATSRTMHSKRERGLEHQYCTLCCTCTGWGEVSRKKSILHIFCARCTGGGGHENFTKIFVIFQNVFLSVFSFFFYFKLDFLL